MQPITRQDEEDSGDEGQDGAMGPNVADVAEHKADEHEEKADQRERSGRADHLCKQADKRNTSVPLCCFTLERSLKLLACFLFPLRLVFLSWSEVDHVGSCFHKWRWKFLLCRGGFTHKASGFCGA